MITGDPRAGCHDLADPALPMIGVRLGPDTRAEKKSVTSRNRHGVLLMKYCGSRAYSRRVIVTSV